MSAIQPVCQDQEYSHPYGDLLVEAQDWVRRAAKLREELNDNKAPLLLDYVSPNSWEALQRLSGLDADAFKSFGEKCKYTCPYTMRDYFGLVPLFIWTANPQQYLKNCYVRSIEMACDSEWNLEQYSEQIFDCKISRIQALLLGSGYTACELMSDGSNSIEPVIMNLSNGDKLVFAAYVWHNK